jgi:hypothetical protein
MESECLEVGSEIAQWLGSRWIGGSCPNIAWRGRAGTSVLAPAEGRLMPARPDPSAELEAAPVFVERSGAWVITVPW